jgi:hypothetical protein
MYLGIQMMLLGSQITHFILYYALGNPKDTFGNPNGAFEIPNYTFGNPNHAFGIPNSTLGNAKDALEIQN